MEFKKFQDGSWHLNIPKIIFIYWDKHHQGNTFEILLFERKVFYFWLGD